MNKNRRTFIEHCFLSGGAIGLRSWILGLPPIFLTERVLANNTKVKNLIFSTDRSGSPVNTNAPHSYKNKLFEHPKESELGDLAKSLATGRSFKLGKNIVVAAEQ